MGGMAKQLFKRKAIWLNFTTYVGQLARHFQLVTNREKLTELDQVVYESGIFSNRCSKLNVGQAARRTKYEVGYNSKSSG
jgi:hypothetical protein